MTHLSSKVDTLHFVEIPEGVSKWTNIDLSIRWTVLRIYRASMELILVFLSQVYPVVLRSISGAFLLNYNRQSLETYYCLWIFLPVAYLFGLVTMTVSSRFQRLGGFAAGSLVIYQLSHSALTQKMKPLESSEIILLHRTPCSMLNNKQLLSILL